MVKRYHPDTVITPEEKRKYTIICARINEAYREATREAKISAGVIDEEPLETPGLKQTEDAIRRGVEWYRNSVTFQVAVFASLFVFIAFQLFSYLAVSKIAPLPETSLIKAFIRIGLILFVAVVIYGILVAGVLDLFLVFVFPRNLVSRLGLSKYENKLLWLFVLASNLAFFFFTSIVPAPHPSRSAFSIYDAIFRVICAGTLPAFFAMKWMSDLVKYKRARKDVGDLMGEMESLSA